MSPARFRIKKAKRHFSSGPPKSAFFYQGLPIFCFFLFAVALCLTDTCKPHLKVHTMVGSLELTWVILPAVFQTWVYQPDLSVCKPSAENHQAQEQVMPPKRQFKRLAFQSIFSNCLLNWLWILQKLYEVPWEALSEEGYRVASGNCDWGFPYQLLIPFQLIPRLWARKVLAQFRRTRVWFPGMLAVSGGCSR